MNQTAPSYKPAIHPRHHVRKSDLSVGGQLLTWSIRQWAVAAHYQRCIGCDLYAAYNDLHCTDAIACLHEMMLELSRSAAKHIKVFSPADALLSPDEATLLRLVANPSGDAATRLARTLVACQSRQLLRHANDYHQLLTAANLDFTGWRHLQLVSRENRGA